MLLYGEHQDKISRIGVVNWIARLHLNLIVMIMTDGHIPTSDKLEGGEIWIPNDHLKFLGQSKIQPILNHHLKNSPKSHFGPTIGTIA